MPITKEQALAELSRRKVSVPEIQPEARPAIFTKEDALGELQRRGVEVPAQFKPEQPIQDVMAFDPFGAAFAEPEATAQRLTGQRAVQAIPSSAKQFASDIAQPFIHPIQTAKSVGTLATGLISKLIPGEQPSEKAVDAVGQFLKERYGGIENIQKTIETDPVGVVSDLSLLLTGGSAAALKTGKIAGITTKTGKALADVGEALGKAGRATEPINLATAPIKAVAKATPQQFINKIFESSAKFTNKLPDIERVKVVETALNEGIVLSRSGLKKLRKDKIRMLNKVDDIIDEGVATGRGKGVVIQTEDLIGQLDSLKDYLLDHPLGADFVDKVDDFANTFRRNPKIGKTMNLQQAQNTKKVLGKFFDSNLDAFGKVTNAAQDSIRHGVMLKLEDVFPEIKALNRKSGDFIALEKVLEPAVARMRNKDIFGLGSKVLAAGGLDGPAKLFATLAETIIGDPKVKSRIAIILNKAKKSPFLGSGKSTLLRQLAFQAGRLSEPQEAESPLGPRVDTREANGKGRLQRQLGLTSVGPS